MSEIIFTFETNTKLKTDIVKEILSDLPEWFGMEEATSKYITQAAFYPLWSATCNGEFIGFINLKETSPDVAEIYSMGVKQRWHHQHIGTSLFSLLETYARDSYKFLQVKTVAQGKYKEYDSTIQFYRSIGFTEFEVFPTLWDEWNPCLIMIKSIAN